MAEDFIERRIVIGLIVSTDYLHRIRPIWKPEYIISGTAKTISSWCIDFYDKYKTAPGKEIESIYSKKMRRADRDDREDMEEILSGMSDEYERADKFNVEYLYDQTVEYFDEGRLKDFLEDI